MSEKRLFTLIVIILSAALFRLVPHPPNFTPAVGVALFSGALLSDKRLALAVVFVSMLLSDFFLGFHTTMPVVYLSLALIAWFSSPSLARGQTLPLVLAALTSSVFFFAITNAGVWLLQDLYPKSLPGLIACYTAALPFFKNSLIGDILYTLILFGGFFVLGRYSPGSPARPERTYAKRYGYRGNL